MHNNYLTLPVVLAMISNHFAFAYGRTSGWLVLVGLMAIGALVRHFFNRRHGGKSLWWIPVVAALAVAGSRSRSARTTHEPGGRRHGLVRGGAAIVTQRCVPCHRSGRPVRVLDARRWASSSTTRQAIVALAQAIKTQAVDSHEMPIGNLTHMTDAERATLGAWIDQGANR